MTTTLKHAIHPSGPKVLYKPVHSVHHNSINPSPCTSLLLHPVRHLLYFASALLPLIDFSRPLLAIYYLHMA